ncbi:hypothetical protein WDV91_11070 [Curtobacterium flaccumfaciens pv. flaccumfaciens]
MTPRSRARALTVATLTTAAAVVLAGCSGGGDSTPSASATPAGKPVSQTCAELLPTSALSVYGQTFELDDSFTPAKGSPRRDHREAAGPRLPVRQHRRGRHGDHARGRRPA